MTSAPAPQSGAIVVRPLKDRAAERDFLNVPFRVYADDPHWVAPLRHVERRRVARSRKHPFYGHGEGEFWVAYRDGSPVGRIGAIVNHLHLERHRDATGHFAMLEAVDDPAVFAKLIGVAEDWLRSKGLTRVAGPFNLSINEECGLLVEGFGTRPAFGLGHARPYYAVRLEELGYTKAIDMLSYVSEGEMQGLDHRRQRFEDAAADAGYRIRVSSRRQLTADLQHLVDLFNDAWSNNWGFVPITEAEARQMIRDLRQIIDPRTFAIAERDGEVVALGCGIPDINEVLQHLRGRLLPFGWIRLAWKLKTRRFSAFRVPLSGVKQTMQRTAAGGIVQTAIGFVAAKAARGDHVKRVEAGWILEDNKGSIRLAELAGMILHKRYRIFARNLSAGGGA